jgi:hypothetical protein
MTNKASKQIRKHLTPITKMNEINNQVEYKKIKPMLVCDMNSTSNCNVCSHKKCLIL